MANIVHYTCYLIVHETKGVVGVRKNPPHLTVNERALKVELKLDKDIFLNSFVAEDEINFNLDIGRVKNEIFSSYES